MNRHIFLILGWFIQFSVFSSTLLAAPRLPVELTKKLLLKQYASALPQLKRLASNGNIEAKYQLAICYLNGSGVAVSAYTAVKLLKQASDKGHSKASYLLGTLYYQGKVIEKDISAAKSYLFIAEQKGHRLAKQLSNEIDQSNFKTTLSRKESQQLLEYAARTGNKTTAEDALENGARINKIDIDGNTPIIIALKNKQYEFADWLLTKKLTVTTADKNNDTPLHFACKAGKLNLAKRIIFLGASLNSKNNNGRTPLINSVISENVDLIKFLLIQGANPNIQDKNKKSAFDYAENKNNSTIIASLSPYRTNHSEQQQLEQKLRQLTKQTKQKDNLYFGWPVLAVAVAQDELKLVKLLLNRGHDPWQQSASGESAISLSAINDEKNYSSLLLNNTSKLTKPKKKQLLELLVMAAKKNNANFINQLTHKLSAKSATEFKFIQSPLWNAIENSNSAAAIELINWQQPDFRSDKEGRNFLHLAAKQNLPKVVSALKNKGFNINRTDLFERSPFWYAADRGNMEVMTLLNSYHANIHQADKDGSTPFHRAVLSGKLASVQALINYAADINKKAKNGNTAIFLAAASYPDILQLLIDKGAQVSLRNHQSYTPLMIAVQNKCIRCIPILLKADANPSRRNSKGENSFDLAEGNQQLTNLLNQ